MLANSPIVRIKRSQIQCEPIGRIIEKGNKHLKAKGLMCEGDKLELAPRVQVKFLCFSSGDIIWLSNGAIGANKCPVVNVSEHTCNPSNVKVCLLRKGGGLGEDPEPTIIYPYTSSLIKTRPDIAWLPVRGATSYKVKVDGYKFGWERIVNQTHLTYPEKEKELSLNGAFRITVIAYRADAPPISDTFAVSLYPQSEIQKVFATIEQIKALGLPEDEAALDIDAVYTSRGFLEESIGLLSQVATSKTTNPTVYRVLGDRYFEAGLVGQANAQYMRAYELAKNSNNTVELTLTQAGREAVEFYNGLPTKINGAQ
ncbi:hypothetical protein NIES2109_57720 (plasmid) [Nostoc sp. HK-01]|nr:hypothetical protein NIES2109_57720 [Nostoc sp. HK-01]